jgi:hypothetical protein
VFAVVWPEGGPSANPGLGGARFNPPDFLSCAGAQLDFPAQQNQGVADVWVPFDQTIAVGWT